MWEEYVIVDYYGTDVFFDFDTYAYRASIGYSAYGSSSLYKDERGTRYRITSFLVGEIKQLTIGLGDGSSVSLEQGNNRLLAGNAADYGDSIIVERILLWSPPNFQPKIGGVIRQTEMAWVKVDGQLREVDKVWTKVNGVVREV